MQQYCFMFCVNAELSNIIDIFFSVSHRKYVGTDIQIFRLNILAKRLGFYKFYSDFTSD